MDETVEFADVPDPHNEEVIGNIQDQILNINR